MNLRKKTILIIVFGFIFIILLFIGYGSVFLESQYQTLEEEQVIKVSQDFIDTISNDLQNMERILRSYSGWNETFQYVQKTTKPFHRTTYNSDYLSSNGISGMIIFNRYGEPLFDQVKKPDSDLITVFSSRQIAAINNITAQYNLLAKRTGAQGIISLGEHDALIASEPVIIDSYSGSAQGTIHFIVWLDSAYLQKNSDSADLLVRYSKNPVPDTSNKTNDKRTTTTHEPVISISPLNSSIITGSFTIRGLSQDEDYTFFIPIHRSINENKQRTIITFISFLILSGLIIGCIVIYFVDTSLLFRIDAIIQKVRISLKERNQLPRDPEHPDKDCNDELDILIQAIEPVFARITQTQNELEQSEEFFRRVIDTFQDGLLIFEEIESGECLVYCNPRSLEILGGTCSYKNIDDFFSDTVKYDLQQVQKKWQEILKSPHAIRSLSFWTGNSPDNSRYILCRFSFIDTQSRGKRILVAISDMTEREIAEELLRESEAKYRFMTENISDVHLQISPDLTITYVSPADEVLRGYHADEVVGKKVWEFLPVHAQKKMDELIRKRFETHYAGVKLEEITIETEVLCKDGRNIWIELVSNPMYDMNSNLTGFHGVFRNITERKNAEEAIAQVNNKINLLSSITRHDVLNQMTVIMNILDIMKEEEKDPFIQSLINTEEIASLRIIRLIEFARDYQDIGIVQPRWFPVRELMNRAISTSQSTGICFRIQIGDLSIFADVLLEKVFFNLIDNSLRHGKSVTTITLEGLQETDGYHLIYMDDGGGVKPDDHDNIFVKGFGKNTGMGLFLIKEILSITGITIEENGTYGVGARFEMTIPEGKFKV